jgi:hypothetical protein
LTVVQHRGEYRIAQYGQWDHYPEGQGITALHFCRKFLREKSGRETFKDQLARVSFAPTDEAFYDKLYADLGIVPEVFGTMKTISVADSEKFKEKYPQLDRDMAADVLRFVWAATEPVLLRNSISFATDSLFCEFAYVVDLDKETFEVFKGYNKQKLGPDERFAKAEREADANKEYEPIKLLKSWSLDALPTKSQFLEECGAVIRELEKEEEAEEDEDDGEDEDGEPKPTQAEIDAADAAFDAAETAHQRDPEPDDEDSDD